MYHIIYKTTNSINEKIYVGAHSTIDLDDGYMGSGKYLKRAIAKYGVENFSTQIIHIFSTPEEMFLREAEIVDQDFVENPNTYNLKVGGEGGWDYINKHGLCKTDAWRAAVEKNFEKYRAGYYDWLANADKTEQRRRISLNHPCRKPGFVASFTGRKHTEETKAAVSKIMAVAQKGPRNSQFGTCWIYHTDTFENRKINKSEADMWLKDGWVLGRKVKRSSNRFS